MVSPLDVVAASASSPEPQSQQPFFQLFPTTVSPLDVVAASASPPEPQSQSPFFQSFPPEIRLIIYDYCAYDYFADGKADPTALLKACKRTALEATAPMQKYARVIFLLNNGLPVSYSDEDFVNADEESTGEDGGSAGEDNASNLDVDGGIPSRWLGVVNFRSAHLVKVEHVFIELMTNIDDLWTTITWVFTEDDPTIHSGFTYGMRMLNEFALSHSWDIKSVSVDLGPDFGELVDSGAKFIFAKGFLEDGIISWVDKIPLLDRLVQQRAINFTGLTTCPFPMIEHLNDSDSREDDGWEDDGNQAY